MGNPTVKEMILIGLFVLITVLGVLSIVAPDESSIPIDTASGVAPLPVDNLNFQEKERAIQGLLASTPKNPALIAELGDLYFEREMFEKAIAEYVKALELAPYDTDTYNDLGLAYYYTGNYELSVEQLEKGTKQDPNFQRLWLSLGYVHASSGVNERAIAALKKAIEINGDNSVGQEAKRILGVITDTSPVR